jgi:magnesium transporter
MTNNPMDKANITLEQRCIELGPREAAELLASQDPASAASVLADLVPTVAQPILAELSAESRRTILAAGSPEFRERLALEEKFSAGSVGRAMEPPVAVFRPEETVGQATESLRDLVKTKLITYGFITSTDGKLVGVITMRDLLFNEPAKRLEEIMLRDIFAIPADMELVEAMKLTLNRHYPVYPVCDGGRLVGLVRGQTLFEQQAIELSAQAGSMVGVEKEERLDTPWKRSLFFRHPWLQLNLLTAFVAAAVVGVFEHTIDKVVVLAVFLPVLAGQSGNTGCQALAVTLRAMTLGELKKGREGAMVFKEGLLGLLNGTLVGITAGLGMFVFASIGRNEKAFMLGVVVFLAMIGSCVVSGISGALVPLILKRLGADPATASSIFLTTATDVVSMGLFLSLATVLVL